MGRAIRMLVTILALGITGPALAFVVCLTPAGGPITLIAGEIAAATAAGAVPILHVIFTEIGIATGWMGTVDGDIQRNTLTLHGDLQGLWTNIDNDFKSAAIVKARAEALQSTQGSYDARAACDSANAAEASGAAIAAVTSARRRVPVAIQDWGSGMRNNFQAAKRLIDMPPEKLQSTVANGESATLSDQAFQDLVQFNNQMINPMPPVDPTKLPDRYKTQAGAVTYDTGFKLYNAAMQSYGEAMNRQATLMAASVPVTPGMQETWREIGSGFTTAGGVAPISIGGTPMISAIDELKTRVYGRYANPYWSGDRLNTMTDVQVYREIAEELSVYNRLLWGIMLNQRTLAYQANVAAGRAITSSYADTLSELRSGMGSSH